MDLQASGTVLICHFCHYASGQAKYGFAIVSRTTFLRMVIVRHSSKLRCQRWHTCVVPILGRACDLSASPLALIGLSVSSKQATMPKDGRKSESDKPGCNRQSLHRAALLTAPADNQ